MRNGKLATGMEIVIVRLNPSYIFKWQAVGDFGGAEMHYH
jgi:hypothetical protein